jgi:hypothetical protein
MVHIVTVMSRQVTDKKSCDSLAYVVCIKSTCNDALRVVCIRWIDTVDTCDRLGVDETQNKTK